MLPQGGGGNALFCEHCYQHEIRARRLTHEDDPPPWRSLKVYNEGGVHYYTGTLLKDVEAKCGYHMLRGRRVRLEPQGARMLAQPLDGRWGVVSVMLEPGSWEIDSVDGQ